MPLATCHPTILIAAEPTLYRAGLVSLLKQQWPAFTIALTADTGQVLELVRTRSIQLLIIDDCLLGRNISILLQRLRQINSTQKTILLASDNPIEPIGTLSHLLLSRHTAPRHLAATIAPLLEATCYYNASSRALYAPPTHFSSRELEVLRLIADDYCNQEIANQLYLSVRTIESHRRSLLQKSGSRTLAGLVAWALRTGMVA
ncbi:MAG: response regulator transcription factor [Hymenobacter sp.]|nr:MAG: response regulator transcription factor [Hymenobacter sp.]